MTPGRFPANVMVAPNSPRARAHESAVPASSEGRASGSITRKNVIASEARSVAAASSRRGSTVANPARAGAMKNGTAMNV